jgi:GntR family transcriptional repressor for pyruvate dehydrogenase complex
VLRDYLECRLILEVEAAGLAAERAGEDDLVVLRERLAAMREAAARAQRSAVAEPLYIDADIDFHRAVVAAAHNAALSRMTAPIHRALALAMPAFARPRLRFERGLPEHERIMDAIASRAGQEARAAMRDHLLTVEGYLREYAEDHGGSQPELARSG